jgi:two-component system, chemotaxis family, protein-glutamate methylesterase/glutaminase
LIRVLVVDDSALAGRVLTDELSREPDIVVIGEAVDPYDARDRILELAPDVVTLDIEMPRMNGLAFLARLMKYRPVPVVVVSSVAPANSDAAMHALELGAVEVIAKPGSELTTGDTAGQLARAVRAAAAANIPRLRPVHTPPHASSPVPAADTAGGTALASLTALAGATAAAWRERIVVIGASTGGPVALEQLLAALPAHAPAVLVVQHMPAGFTAAFARRLNERCAIEVREAADGTAVVPGTALIAPGGRHMMLLRRNGRLHVGVRQGPPVHFQRPAVDVLFHSVAQLVGRDAVGVLLTGMGADGASGMRALRDAGAHTIAQDEQSCAVFSMPKEAIRFEGVCEVLPLPQIAAAVLSLRRRARTGDRSASRSVEPDAGPGAT